MNKPIISIKIGNVNTTALVDTGANTSCLKQAFYEANKSIFNKHESFPLSNIVINTAIGTQSKKLKKIIFIDTDIEELHFQEQYLIVPNLIADVIIGTDILLKYKTHINLENSTCTFFGMNMDVDCRKHYQHTMKNNNLSYPDVQKANRYCQHNHRCYTIIQFSSVQQEPMIHHINYVDYQPHFYEEATDKNIILKEKHKDIDHVVNDNTTLNDAEKRKFKQLLYEYTDVFSNKPGLCNKFEYNIKLKDHTPFKGHYYPIPVCYQEIN